MAAAAPGPVFLPLAPECLERLKEELVDGTEGCDVKSLVVLRGSPGRELNRPKKVLKTMAAFAASVSAVGEGREGGVYL